MLSVQDSAAAEEVEQVTQPDTVASDSTTNLLSSGSFSILLNDISLHSVRCTVLSYLVIIPVCVQILLSDLMIIGIIFLYITWRNSIKHCFIAIL